MLFKYKKKYINSNIIFIFFFLDDINTIKLTKLTLGSSSPSQHSHSAKTTHQTGSSASQLTLTSYKLNNNNVNGLSDGRKNGFEKNGFASSKNGSEFGLTKNRFEPSKSQFPKAKNGIDSWKNGFSTGKNTFDSNKNEFGPQKNDFSNKNVFGSYKNGFDSSKNDFAAYKTGFSSVKYGLTSTKSWNDYQLNNNKIQNKELSSSTTSLTNKNSKSFLPKLDFPSSDQIERLLKMDSKQLCDQKSNWKMGKLSKVVKK